MILEILIINYFCTDIPKLLSPAIAIASQLTMSGDIMGMLGTIASLW